MSYPVDFVDTGDCTQGYYCIGSSHLAEPNDGVIGAICPIHHICPTGSDTFHACDAGK